MTVMLAPRIRRAMVTVAALAALVGGSAGCTTSPSTSAAARSAAGISVSSSPVSPATGPASGAGGASGTPTHPQVITPTRRPPRPAAVAAPTVPAVSGYRFAAAPGTVTAGFARLARRDAAVVSGVTVRSWTGPAGDTGTMVLMALVSSVAGNAAVENAVVRGTVGGLATRGATVTSSSVAGQRMSLTRSSGSCVLGWYRAGVVALIVGGSATAPMLALAGALVRAS